MKKVPILIVFLIAVIAAASAQNTKSKVDPVGTWKFDAPYAPEGYTSGTIIIGFAEKKHSATMSFTGSEYKLTGENVKVEKDTVYFSVYLEGQDIKVTLTGDANARLVGKAVYSEGELPLTLTKEKTPSK